MHNYHFVYKTVNLVNGSYYIGVHSTNDLDDGYLGSGTKLNRAIKKYGKTNFSRTILKMHNSRDDALFNEAELVNVKDPLTYNICEGGGSPPSRKGLTSATAKLKGNSRTDKQKSASIQHSTKMKNREAWNRKAITVFNNKYNSKTQACRELQLSKTQLDFYLKSEKEFLTPSELKYHIWTERSRKLSELRRMNGS